MRDLDTIIRDLSPRSSNPIGFMDGAAFFAGMKKIAEDGMPDTTGAIEGPFTVPLDQAVELIAAMVSNEFKTQVYYIFYANMLRGLSHESIAEEFMEHAQDELEHATYLLRRMSVLSPGGINIPPYPPPEPMTDPAQIVQTMIVVEQVGLSLWKQLHSIMGDNPMKYTIEQFLQTEEAHQDELWQLVESAQVPPMPTAEPTAEPAAAAQPSGPEPSKTQVKVETSAPQQPAMEPKIATILLAADMRKRAAASKDALMGQLALATKSNNAAEVSKLRTQLKNEHGMTFDKKAAVATYEQLQNWAVRARLQADAIHAKDQKRVVSEPKFTGNNDDKKLPTNSKLSMLIKKAFGLDAPAPGMDSPEAYVEREQQLGAQQAMAEAAHAKTVAMQATQAAQQAQAEATAAQQQLQAAQQQVEQLSQQATQESQQSLMATQQAAEAEARAADHSIAKMQLGMRVNQLRQELANMVMQDPVAESAATVSDLAAQGMPATPMQQMQAEQQQAAAANGEAPPSAETAEQQQEATDAQADAQQQTQQAEQSAEKDKAKGQGTTVSVKTSEAGTVVQRVASGRGPVGATAAAPGVLQGLVAKARPFAPHLAAGAAGVGLIGGGLALAHHASNQRAKVASPADRRMARAILDGPEDALSHSLIGLLRKHAPGATGAASAEKAMHDVGNAVSNGVDPEQVSTLGAKLRPHAPGFVAGLGAGIIGNKMMSGNQQTQPPAYYVQ